MRYVYLSLISVVVIGCSSRQESPEGSDPILPDAAAEQTSGAVTAAYEVHEWGLLRAGVGDVLEVGAISPPGTTELLVVDKPVLYFHATAPVHLERVRVEAVGGSVREHWPLTTSEAFPSSIEWSDFTLDATEAAGGDRCAGAFPSASEPPCSDLPGGELCESLELGTVISPSATCLQSGATRLPFLFYRSRTATFAPPLRVRALSSGELQLTNNGDAPIPGWIVRIRRNGGQVRTIAVSAPGAHATITIGSDFENAVTPTSAVPMVNDEDIEPVSDSLALPGNQEPGRRAVRMTLSEIGLDAGEIDAFLRAWDGALFGARMVPLVDLPRRNASDRRGTLDGIPIDVLTDDQTTMTDSILYFLPETACDGVSRLTFTPAPTRVVRALALWQPAR